MQPLGTSGKTAGKGLSLRMGGVGMAIMLVVFLVAVVFAANENDVVGWLVVIISLGWLLVFSFVVFTVRSAARKASARIDEFNRTAGGGMAGRGPAGTSSAMRDEKLDHSFKIVQVQARVIRDHLGKDQGVVDRAIETIEITSHNARSMMKNNDDGPVEGTVVD
ncbi:hypothetical protein [uncultured Arthrobacter sp.]|uniref:hypothetical protein n=1 Tax=uncultured Arthrobacter sp. TaxID=114050 RepID=UPI002606680A|nr:hypothetical protein [uncultured Arthrobacter sp.]